MTRGCWRGRLVSNLVIIGLVCSTQLPAQEPALPAATPDVHLDDNARTAFIRGAQLWSPTDISSLDLKAGPPGAGAFQPNELVTCEYVETKLHGSTRKFACALAPGHVMKVRYGAHNREVHASVVATRLLWALGFGADRAYPVQVRCIGCSSDPWNRPQRVKGDHLFAPAVIEQRPDGYAMTDDRGSAGWSWSELDLVDERAGGASLAQKDALKLLAVFMQHTDTKREQQRMWCLPGGLDAAGHCVKPYLMLHDVGLTFGHANAFNASGSGSIDLDKWASTPIWKDAHACVGHLRKSITGTLENPRISEAGRSFLANLLLQLTDQQLNDLFDVAGVGRDADSDNASSDSRIGQWVAAFKHKRDEIVLARCPQ